MKKLSIFFTAGLLFFMMSCADDELSPIVTFDKVGKGAYVKLLELRTGEYDLANFGSSAFAFRAQFVDLEQGDLVSTYDLYVSFADNTPGNGDNSKAEVLYSSSGQGDFEEGATGFKELDVNLPLSEAASKLGLTSGQLSAGDFFNYRGELVLTDGRVFGKGNSTAPVNGSAFAGFFDFAAKCTCPLADATFSGDYKIEYVSHTPGAFGAIFGATPPVVTFNTVSGSTTQRSFDWVYLPDSYAFGGQTFRFDFVCTEVQITDHSSGVGCGSGAITIVQDGPLPVDITDDSEMIWNLIEYDNDGGCGVSPNPLTIRFVKQ